MLWLKGIIRSKMRGFNTGVIRTVSNSHIVADVFRVNFSGLRSLMLKLVSSFRVKKGVSALKGPHATKKLVPRLSLAAQPMYPKATRVDQASIHQ